MTKYTLLIMLMHIILVIFIIFLAQKLCKKKIIKISLIILCSICVLYLITLSIDVMKVNNLKRPIFAKENKLYCSDCTNSSSYNGIGYQIDINYYSNGQIEKIEMKMFNRVIADAKKLITVEDN